MNSEPPMCEPMFDELADEGAADLYEPKNPLAGYPCPVTRRCKPDALDRPMVDVLPSL